MKHLIHYLNQTDCYQVIRIADFRCPLEKAVFPKATITFEAFSDSICEVSGEYLTSMIPEKMLCIQLSNEV